MLVDVQKSLLVLNYDKDDRILILNYLILSEIFGYKSNYEIAYYYLVKAEKKAIENEFYSILEGIYEQMIEISLKYFDVPLLEIIKKQKNVIEQKKKNQSVQYLMAELRWRLRKFNFAAQGTEIVAELDNINNKLQDTYLIENSPSIKIKVQENIRFILVQKGDFESLNIYLSNKLHEFEKEKVFNKNNYNKKIIMQTWLINANIKLLNFHLAYKYSNELKESLHKFKGLYYNNYIWAYFQCVFAACFYSNQLKRCLQILNTFSKEKEVAEHISFHSWFNINSAIIYFCLNDIKQANKHLNELLNPAFFDLLSDEMKLTVKITELLFYFENSDFKFFDFSINNLKQNHKKSLKLEKNKRQKDFLSILKLLSKDNEILNLKTEKAISTFIDNSPPFEVGTNEGINFKCWLISKLEKKDFYTILIKNCQKKINN